MDTHLLHKIKVECTHSVALTQPYSPVLGELEAVPDVT